MFTKQIAELESLRGVVDDRLIDVLRGVLGNCQAVLEHRGQVVVDNTPAIDTNLPEMTRDRDFEDQWAAVKVRNAMGQWINNQGVVVGGWAFAVQGPMLVVVNDEGAGLHHSSGDSNTTEKVAIVIEGSIVLDNVYTHSGTPIGFDPTSFANYNASVTQFYGHVNGVNTCFDTGTC